MAGKNIRVTVEMDRNKDCKKDKTPAIETFPTDETPTPTKILRMADMDLFQDLKENPFDAHFRKAAEAVKQGDYTILLKAYLNKFFSILRSRQSISISKCH